MFHEDEQAYRWEEESASVAVPTGCKRPVGGSVLDQLRALSSGTIASLTGLETYDSIERVQRYVMDWTERAIRAGIVGQYDPWQNAWAKCTGSTRLVECALCEEQETGS